MDIIDKQNKIVYFFSDTKMNECASKFSSLGYTVVLMVGGKHTIEEVVSTL